MSLKRKQSKLDLASQVASLRHQERTLTERLDGLAADLGRIIERLGDADAARGVDRIADLEGLAGRLDDGLTRLASQVADHIAAPPATAPARKRPPKKTQ